MNKWIKKLFGFFVVAIGTINALDGKLAIVLGVCSQNVIAIENDIREPLAKDWEGQHTPPKKTNEDRWTALVDASAEHGGETKESVSERIQRVVGRLSEWNSEQGHVILVTHGYPSYVLLQTQGENTLLNTAEAKILPLPLNQ